MVLLSPFRQIVGQCLKSSYDLFHVLSKLRVESQISSVCARKTSCFLTREVPRTLRDLNTSRHGKIVNYRSDYHWFGAGIAQPVWWFVLGLDDLKVPRLARGLTRSFVDGWRGCFPRK
jgi:hypothetical protein